jgi:hypothetical protein
LPKRNIIARNHGAYRRYRSDSATCLVVRSELPYGQHEFTSPSVGWDTDLRKTGFTDAVGGGFGLWRRPALPQGQTPAADC